MAILRFIFLASYYFSSTPLSFTNSFFESMSGLTTIGATILGHSSTFQIEELSIGILFWRVLHNL